MALDLKFPGPRRPEVASVIQDYVDEGAFSEAKQVVLEAASTAGAAASAVSDAFSGPVGEVEYVAGRGPDGVPRRQTVGNVADPRSIATMGDITAFHDDLILDGGNF